MKRRLLIYPPLALLLLILGGSTAILLLTPDTFGFVRGGDARATQSALSSTLTSIDSTAQFLADTQAREFELAITRTAVLTMTDESVMTREAENFRTREANINQTGLTQQAQSTQLSEAQSTLNAQQTAIIATATMNRLVSDVTMTAGAQFSAGNSATQQANQTAQANNQQIASDLQATNQALSVAVNQISGTQNALITTQTQIAQSALSTQTAVAQVNIAQATQNALSFEATQNAVVQQATQNALNFAMTQSAVNQNATQVALGFATPLPSIQPIVSPSPTQFTDTFGGASLSDWVFYPPDAWGVDPRGGFIARENNGAWMLSTQRYIAYTFDITILSNPTPTPIVLVLNRNQYSLTVVRVIPQAGNNVLVGLYRGIPSVDLLTGAFTEWISTARQFDITDTYTMRVDVSTNQIQVYLNEYLLFTHVLDALPELGQVGAYMTEGMGIQ
ncbi:MAG: hypothetical protein KJ043_07110, partial [Anaerolineae bacterium]|nr:hypothetical protein [Anaerolineae bacterium]